MNLISINNNLVITNGSLIGSNAGGGTAVDSDILAFIDTTYHPGNICTCTDGDITLQAKDTSGNYIFGIRSTGTWTVYDGSVSKQFNIAYYGQKEFANFIYYIYKDNTLIMPDNITYPNYVTKSIVDNQLVVTTVSGGYFSSTYLWKTDLTDYNHIDFDLGETHGTYCYVGFNSTDNITDPTGLTRYTQAANVTNTTVTIDCSDVTGIYYVTYSQGGNATNKINSIKLY